MMASFSASVSGVPSWCAQLAVSKQIPRPAVIPSCRTAVPNLVIDEMLVIRGDDDAVVSWTKVDICRLSRSFDSFEPSDGTGEVKGEGNSSMNGFGRCATAPNNFFAGFDFNPHSFGNVDALAHIELGLSARGDEQQSDHSDFPHPSSPRFENSARRAARLDALTAGRGVLPVPPGTFLETWL